MRAALKLLTLLAVLFLPLGMAAPAAATQHHSAAMPMQGCPDQAPNHASEVGFAQCAMACSAALPAALAADDDPLLMVSAPTRLETATQLDGLHPETATPPPKPS
jgi:hypothetical protein